MTRFSYERLPSSRAIRLIKFLPGPDPTCQIVAVEVEKAPPYVALSYTWGSKNLSRVIIANGAEIPITANLAEAIDAVFLFVRERSMMFWADSLCINQADVYERSRQVRLMNTIYRSAEMVAIWLGPAAYHSDLAFDKMEEWKARFDGLKQRFGGSEELAVTSISSDDPFYFGACGSEEQRALEAFRMLCRRPWWKRAWIVQEGTIANPVRTILFCGSRSIDWTYLRAALQITHHATHYQSSGIMSTDFNDSMAMRLDNFRKDREEGANIGLLRVLRLIRAYDCQDPRDKLYAALGMAMDVYEDEIVPDYTKSSSAVYSDVVRFCIDKSNGHSLDFLGEVWRSAPGTGFEHQHDRTLPSWTPDWTFQASLRPFEKVLDLDAYGGSKKAYNASGMCNGHCYIDGSQLCLQGSFLDHIVRVSSICEWNLADGGLDTERSWIPENAEKLYFSGETLMEAFNHTLVADIGRQNTQSDSHLSRGFAIDWELVGQDRNDMTAEERQRQSWMLVDTKMTTFGRRLFETRRGFIGLGPAAARVNDEIWCLLGGQVWYVLRSREESHHHEFVGECYVHGMMDGQACEDEEFSIRDIVLV
ncbi:heterokaryon incompatibility [Pyrenophora seminiperda CCB06]|uniref:Heterokaryon incompatibility n=1 Tax=Pyrenophora seminiperda CCB06 TaxID=1302712 RepID=A0A3M7MF31_9PLEO|nr:heterokaryon incompatibility [Pyrenophora seminiperda CCB06]